MNSNELSNVSGIKISGSDSSDYFIKTNGGIDTNTYLQSADLSALESKTQNQTATDSRTTFDKGIQFKLRDGSGDVFFTYVK